MLCPRVPDSSLLETEEKYACALSAAVELGMMMVASTLTLPELMVSVMWSGRTPSNREARLVEKEAASKELTSPDSTKVVIKTGWYEPPG